MNLVALKMLWGDKAKYLGLVFGIAFATLLMNICVPLIVLYTQPPVFGKKAKASGKEKGQP